MKVSNPSNGAGKVVYVEIKVHQIYAISCMESIFFLLMSCCFCMHAFDVFVLYYAFFHIFSDLKKSKKSRLRCLKNLKVSCSQMSVASMLWVLCLFSFCCQSLIQFLNDIVCVCVSVCVCVCISLSVCVFVCECVC